jgi:hypothetical protein
MLEPMLSRAESGSARVAGQLGYSNVDFAMAYLEQLPLKSNSVDVILSNCVLNLSTNKRRAFREMFRLLRPGGRLVIADVLCESNPDPAIRNDDVLRGECIAGALTQKDLFGLLRECGLTSARVLSRFPYRKVKDHQFFSMTYRAYKPADAERRQVMYRGPFEAVMAGPEQWIHAGQTYSLALQKACADEDGFYLLDDQGNVVGLDTSQSCRCGVPPEESSGQPLQQISSDDIPSKMESDCMLCGAPLEYFSQDRELICVYCKTPSAANAACREGHFVCDSCHTKDALGVIERICITTKEQDMIGLMKQIRTHEAVKINGPEHHAMVAGIVIATYRNLGGSATDDMIGTAIQRGAKIPGGYCGFAGACGAALGAGIAVGILMESNPLKPVQRRSVQSLTSRIMTVLSHLEAARCCQRESWLALKELAKISADYLPVELQAREDLVCRQAAENRECLGSECPLHPDRVAGAGAHVP